jgi:glycolate oxidase
MGYNLTGIIIGSEGTLAVITKIYLRLIPAPPVSMDILVPFPGLEEAIDSVYRIMRSRIVPAAIEFMEEGALRLVSRHLQSSMLFPDAGAHLLIQVDGATREDVFRDIERIAGAVSVPEENIIIADSAFDRERIWKARRSIREAINLESPVFLAEDCSVPRSMIPRFLRSVKAHCESRGLNSVMFGHAGDGNVHIDILKGDMPYEEWKAMLPDLKREIYGRALELGGAISGEHGIGFLRRDYLPMGLSEAAIDLHRRIKAAFDPEGILNPHKVMPEKNS